MNHKIMMAFILILACSQTPVEPEATITECDSLYVKIDSLR